MFTSPAAAPSDPSIAPDVTPSTITLDSSMLSKLGLGDVKPGQSITIQATVSGSGDGTIEIEPVSANVEMEGPTEPGGDSPAEEQPEKEQPARPAPSVKGPAAMGMKSMIPDDEEEY